MDTLAVVTSALESAEVSYWIDSGTLLGIIRDGKTLSWDKDVDISILDSELDKMPTALENLSKQFRVRVKFAHGKPVVHVLLPKNGSLKADIKVFSHVGDHYAADVYTQRLHRRRPIPKRPRLLWWVKNVLFVLNPANALNVAFALYEDSRVAPRRLEYYSFPWNRVFKRTHKWLIPSKHLPPVRGPRGMLVPRRTKEYLAYRYGDWKTPRQSWNYAVDDQSYVRR